MNDVMVLNKSQHVCAAISFASHVDRFTLYGCDGALRRFLLDLSVKNCWYSSESLELAKESKGTLFKCLIVLALDH